MTRDYDQRAAEDQVLIDAAALDPDDDSLRAEHLREVAASITDHRKMAARRAEWENDT